jgi:hypothetical protein
VIRASAHRFLNERADPYLFGGSQLLQRESDWPHLTFIKVRHIVEAKRHVPLFELLPAAEEADDSAFLGIRGHPVPESWRKGWRDSFDYHMEPLAHGAIRFLHRGDSLEHGTFPVRFLRGLLGAALFFLVLLPLLQK